MVGNGAPRWTAGWSNEFRWHRFTGYALVDHQLGGLVRAGTWAIYNGTGNAADYDDPGPGGMPIGQVRAQNATAVTRIYMQNATFTKLREMSVSWELGAWRASRDAVPRALRVSVSGRNLRTWARCHCADPEFDDFASLRTLQRNRELGAYPPSRTFWITLQTEW